jgi:hypothetical protein
MRRPRANHHYPFWTRRLFVNREDAGHTVRVNIRSILVRFTVYNPYKLHMPVGHDDVNGRANQARVPP